MAEAFKIKVGEHEVPIVDIDIQKGQTKGMSYPSPDFDGEIDFDKAVEVWGKEKLADILFSELRRQANTIHKEALTEVTGKDDWREASKVELSSEQVDNYRARYAQMVADWSPRGLTQKQLKEEIRNLTEQLTSVVPVTTRVNGILVPDVNAPETQKFYKIAEKLRAKQMALDAKKSKDEDSADTAAPASTAVAA
jgi:hypothetical protein